jgi:uncharacterized protein (DUF1501 family)
MNRRTLLKFIASNALLMPFYTYAKSPSLKIKRLIVIELKGGNDGLNTVIPYSNPIYYALRPTLAIQKDSVLKLNKDIGFHHSMKEMKYLFEQKELAIVQGVGYPKPNMSHFRSIDIWNTASDSDEYLDIGWLNTLNFFQTDMLRGIILGGDYGPLVGAMHGTIKINKIKNFLHQSKQIQGRIAMVGNNHALLHILETEAEIQNSAHLLHKYLKNTKEPPYPFKKSSFAKQMASVTRLINSGIKTPFYKVSLGSFDTHFNQLNKHAKLLEELSSAIGTLRENLLASNEWDNTIIMTYSEFGRRASENASKGTDHGTAAPLFVAGGKIRGGIYGSMPSLKNLDANGNLIYTTDFRAVYEGIARGFLHASSPQTHSFHTLDLFG